MTAFRFPGGSSFVRSSASAARRAATSRSPFFAWNSSFVMSSAARIAALCVSTIGPCDKTFFSAWSTYAATSRVYSGGRSDRTVYSSPPIITLTACFLVLTEHLRRRPERSHPPERRRPPRALLRCRRPRAPAPRETSSGTGDRARAAAPLRPAGATSCSPAPDPRPGSASQGRASRRTRRPALRSPSAPLQPSRRARATRPARPPRGGGWSRAGRAPAHQLSRRRTPSSPSRTSSPRARRSEEHTSELQSRRDLVCRLLLEKKKTVSSPFSLLYWRHWIPSHSISSMIMLVNLSS